jgi:DNA polymerase III subunit alpha
MSDYVHLHNHTHYSLLDAACTPDQLINAAKEDGQSAIALTDHGVMFGCYEFYKKAKKAGIKPILGCEVYLATGGRREFKQTNKLTGTRNYNHLVLLAKNDIGYKNLMKLCSLGHTEGFYYKPRIDRELLVQYKEGLIATSACLASPINDALLRKNYDEALAHARWFKDQFGDDFYIEVQNHGLPEDQLILEGAPRIAQQLGIKLIATNDCHYIKKEHAVPHNVLLNIKDVSAATAGSVDIFNLRYRVPEMYFKSQEQMKELFKEMPTAIETTIEVAEKCDVNLKSDLKMPIFPIPSSSNAKDLDEYLEQLTMEGLEERYPNGISKEAMDRANFELGVIKNMGYAGYFLIVQDFIKSARNRGVRVGPGRGSAAGSLVAYALTITNVDPLKYDLLFERFLNPDRVSMPDIDIDFNDEKRDVVIEYVKEKYGSDAVAQIITFGTLSTRAVIKDVGRVLGVPLATINSITEKIPVIMGKVTKLRDALELPELRWVKQEQDPKIKQMIEYAGVLEGFARNSSLHAAGVVIAPGAITDYVPIYKTPNTAEATQFTMKDLEDAGLLKMDFLGLATLSIIDRTLEMVKENHGIEIDIEEIDFQDQPTYSMISSGKTLAIFQFESPKMTEYLQGLKPSTLDELVAMNALYRPGPMDNIPDFIDRKFGRKEITYLHPKMEQVLNSTNGIIVYQEQVMQLVQILAGFTLAQADLMRRAMGKKDEKLMQEQRDVFVKGAKETSDIEKSLAEQIFDLIVKFASYGFNKSHSVAYAYLAYQTAWLKCHYPAEFLAANMTSELNNLEKITALIEEAGKFDIKVLPPSINKSGVTFTASDDKTIVFGMAGIKGVGIPAVESILKARTESPFVSIYDFTSRVDIRLVNKRALESLVCAGAFDELGSGHRAQYFEAIDSAIEYAKAVQGGKQDSMDSLFGNDDFASVVEPRLPDCDVWEDSERLEREYNVLNFYVSGHPLQQYHTYIHSFSTLLLGRKDSPLVGKSIRACGILTGVRTRLDKREKTIAFAQLEDFTGKAEAIFWSDSYSAYSEYIKDGTPVLIIGKSEKREDNAIKITADEVILLTDAPQRYGKGFNLRIDANAPKSVVHELYSLVSSNGVSPVTLNISIIENEQPIAQYTSKEIKLPMDINTIQKLTTLLGKGNVKIMTEV